MSTTVDMGNNVTLVAVEVDKI